MSWNKRYSDKKPPVQRKIRTLENGFAPPVKREECGSRPGYRKHLRNNEVPCDKCKDHMALTERFKKVKLKQMTENPEGLTVPQQFEQRKDILTTPVKRIKPAECGTSSGYDRHIRENSPICDGCQAAQARRKKDYNSRMKPVLESDPEHPFHGTQTGVNIGCRCDRCKTLRNQRLYKQKAKQLEKLKSDLDDPRHGTINAYTIGCRCDKCSEAHHEYNKQMYRKRQEQGLPENDSRHGTTKGYSLGCRCRDCRDAKNKYDRERKLMKKDSGWNKRYAAKISNPLIDHVDRDHPEVFGKLSKNARSARLRAFGLFSKGSSLQVLGGLHALNHNSGLANHEHVDPEEKESKTSSTGYPDIKYPYAVSMPTNTGQEAFDQPDVGDQGESTEN